MTVELHKTMDAQTWAKEFLEIVYRSNFVIDEDLMLGWFANAIMCGYDHAGYEQENKLSASEAIYGFCGWLLSREEHVSMSSSSDAGIVVELIDQFCKINHLDEPRHGWTKNLAHPTTNPLLEDIEFVN